MVTETGTLVNTRTLATTLNTQAHGEAFAYAWNRINNSTPHGVRDGDKLTEDKLLGFTTHGAWLILGLEYPPQNVRYIVQAQIVYDVARKDVVSVSTLPAMTPQEWEKVQAAQKAQ